MLHLVLELCFQNDFCVLWEVSLSCFARETILSYDC